MTNRVSSFIKKTLIGKKKNLISLDEPYQVMSRLLKDCVVTGIIDAGASNGRISKRLLRFFPNAHVYAFEPNSLYADTLLEFAKADHRFHPQFLALSDQKGTADLYITISPGNTSLLPPKKGLGDIDPQGAPVEKIEKIKTVTIDEWVDRNDDLSIQLMKFDIQGGELKALKGAVHTLQTSALIVYSEIWFNPLYDGAGIYCEIDLFLRKYGFILYDIFKPKYSPNGALMWGNAIFLHAGKLGL